MKLMNKMLLALSFIGALMVGSSSRICRRCDQAENCGIIRHLDPMGLGSLRKVGRKGKTGYERPS